jgi:hypothetical protein
MATCVEARKVHQDSQKDLHDFERMLQTPRYTTLLTDADKERVAQKLVELKAARDEKGKEVTNALSALKDTNWWPVGPNQDEGAAEKYRDLIQYALQLDKTASEMYQAYVTKTLNAPAPASASGAVPQTAVDVSPHDSARPLKRRRVSNAADDAAPSLDPADVAELEKMRERLENLDERVAEIQNDLMSLETQNADDIFAQIDARLEGFSLEPRDHADGPSSSELKRVEESVKKTNKDMDDLGLEIALLISESEKIRTQSELLDKEREKQNADFAAVSFFDSDLSKQVNELFTDEAAISSTGGVEQERSGNHLHSNHGFRGFDKAGSALAAPGIHRPRHRRAHPGRRAVCRAPYGGQPGEGFGRENREAGRGDLWAPVGQDCAYTQTCRGGSQSDTDACHESGCSFCNRDLKLIEYLLD